MVRLSNDGELDVGNYVDRSLAGKISVIAPSVSEGDFTVYVSGMVSGGVLRLLDDGHTDTSFTLGGK